MLKLSILSNKNDNLNAGLQLPKVHITLSTSLRDTFISRYFYIKFGRFLVWEGIIILNKQAYDSFALEFCISSNWATDNAANKRTLADPNLQDNQGPWTNHYNATTVVNTELLSYLQYFFSFNDTVKDFYANVMPCSRLWLRGGCVIYFKFTPVLF